MISQTCLRQSRTWKMFLRDLRKILTCNLRNKNGISAGLIHFLFNQAAEKPFCTRLKFA